MLTLQCTVVFLSSLGFSDRHPLPFPTYLSVRLSTRPSVRLPVRIATIMRLSRLYADKSPHPEKAPQIKSNVPASATDIEAAAVQDSGSASRKSRRLSVGRWLKVVRHFP